MQSRLRQDGVHGTSLPFLPCLERGQRQGGGPLNYTIPGHLGLESPDPGPMSLRSLESLRGMGERAVAVLREQEQTGHRAPVIQGGSHRLHHSELAQANPSPQLTTRIPHPSPCQVACANSSRDKPSEAGATRTQVWTEQRALPISQLTCIWPPGGLLGPALDAVCQPWAR